MALVTALLQPGSLSLVLSPSLRQSGELFRKVAELYTAVGRPVPSTQSRDSKLHLELANGSRVISLPGTEAKVRGFSKVNLLIVDEASRVPDDLYLSVRPFLAVSGGSLVALSTPWAKMGWYYEAWHGESDWDRVKVPAAMCPRISKAFLREEWEELGPRWYAMEYDCTFTDAVDALFTEEQVRRAMDNRITPLFPDLA